jgi:aminoglycoside phosphotransferase (APT) family kinase protein
MIESSAQVDALLPNPTVDALCAWMDAAGLGSGPLQHVVPVGGGTQNIMLRITRSGRDFVLRRGPRHPRPTSNDALRREMVVLAALGATNVPHARLIEGCADPSVLGDSVFYLMDPVSGFNTATVLAPTHAASGAVRHQIGLCVVDALLTLEAVDPAAVGLDGIGRADGFLARQVPRWLSELEGYRRVASYDGSQLPGVEAIATWLESQRPLESRPGLMHGDFHLGNVMIAPDGPEVVAIVDWEMCTVGDPLLDLGWLLATWAGPGEGADLMDSQLSRAGGLASPEELIARYAAGSSRSLEHLLWYRVLACFKLGIVLEGTYVRSLVGQADAMLGRWMHARTVRLFERALGLIDHA